MTPIAALLAPGSAGPAVGNLQDGLRLLMDRGVVPENPSLRARLAVERGDQKYGDGTAKLVSIFQEARRLEASGTVEERTAAALNASLKELGAFDPAGPAAAEPPSVVAGRAAFEDGRPLTPGSVRASHVLQGATFLLAEAGTDSEGRYTLRYPKPAGGAAVVLRVEAARERGGPALAAADRPDPKAVEVVDLTVANRAGVVYAVEGRVGSARTAAVGGLRVQVVAKAVGRDDVVLATAATDEQGRYRVGFTDLDLAAQSLAAADLQAKAFQGDTLLAASEVSYGVTGAATLNVLLPDGRLDALNAEHTTLKAAVARHFGGALADLKEDDSRQDLSHLANKTGWDARAVAMASLADRFGRDHAADDGAKLPAEAYYALFRAGHAADPVTLFRLDRAAVGAAWQAARDAGVAPKMADAEVKKHLDTFQALATAKSLDAPPAVGVSKLGEVLGALQLGDAQQKAFAALHVEHRADAAAFWTAVEASPVLQADAARLRFGGKLAFLTLNNAPLVTKLLAAAGAAADPLALARQGFAQPEAWRGVLAAGVPVPPEIPGATDAERQANYADTLAAHVRLSYPTAAVAHLAATGRLDLKDGATDHAPAVAAFLTAQQGRFEIGTQAVERFLKANPAVSLAAPVLAQVKRFQRVDQLTTGDGATAGLLASGHDSAQSIARQDRAAFVEANAQHFGGDAVTAGAAHDRATQVHGAVLNLVAGHRTARNGFELRSLSPTQPPPNGDTVIAYPTLETLVGSMDFCACDHCRSVLSPAAYLVDLLHFLDVAPAPPGVDSPLKVFLAKRPDAEHLPLTCENTNVALPSIDLVNETLEYFVATDSLTGYAGHDTASADTADLLASPQFVNDQAYSALQSADFPAPLPFHRPLEVLRGTLGALGLTLGDALAGLRAAASPFAARDLRLEALGLSRREAGLLSKAAAADPVAAAYGFPAGTADAAATAALASAKGFARRLDLSYQGVADLLRTRFANPDADAVPRFQRLGLSFDELRAARDSAAPDAEAAFTALVASRVAPPDPADYGGNVFAWVKQAPFGRLAALVTLTETAPGAPPNSFDTVQFLTFQPATPGGDRQPKPGFFLRLHRLIRLWKKTGWTLAQTDAAVRALLPPAPSADPDRDDPAGLDAAFDALLPRLGVVATALKELGLTPGNDLLPLLACWAPIDTHGPASLYRKLFLNAAVLGRDAAFADAGTGDFPRDPDSPLLDHRDALRAAFGLTGDEFDAIALDLKLAAAKLTLADLSAVYRRGWLARKLKVSVRELLALARLTGIDPFAPPDGDAPPLLDFARLVRDLKARSLKPSALASLVWDDGAAPPAADAQRELARALRADLAAVDAQFAAAEGPPDALIRSRLALVNPPEVVDLFWALLTDAHKSAVDYTQAEVKLSAAIATAAGAQADRLAYDSGRHRLSFRGELTPALAAALTLAAGAPAGFPAAVGSLAAQYAATRSAFFAGHPALKAPFDAYRAAGGDDTTRQRALLADLTPLLAPERKRRQALARLAGEVAGDSAATAALLDDAANALHADADPARPALDDFLAAAVPGLTVVQSAGGPGTPSAVARGLLEAPESDFFTLFVTADPAAAVTLALDGVAVALQKVGGVSQTTAALSWKAGGLVAVEVTVTGVAGTPRVEWETPSRPREAIPERYRYPGAAFESLKRTHTRFTRSAALAAALGLSAPELARPQLAGRSWLNALPAPGPAAVPRDLLPPLRDRLDYAAAKADLAPAGDDLARALAAPAAGDPLPGLFGTDAASLAALLTHFGLTRAGLADGANLRRVAGAAAVLAALGVPLATLAAALTNDPTPAQARAVQDALRARHDPESWRELLRPLNDALRGRQRDALVAFALHRLREAAGTAHVDTPDKLFEYFLMDVQSEPVVQTSRVRHVLSSAQLFVERCLMNLEPLVSPKSLPAKRWAWMKRYRVWEANRKVFLFPENWVEPELRDDKSPFFKELESELLQGDITEDAAAGALLNYLTKLGEVAQLEVCGTFHVEEDARANRGEVDHVVARTAGAARKHYYRRREGGAWTPWEAVQLDIEDNPIQPAVWNDRLFLFWLRILQKGQTDPAVTKDAAADGDSNALSGVSFGTARRMAAATGAATTKVTISAVLCWSEFANGKWQPAKTSDVANPMPLGDVTPTGFDRATLRLAVGIKADRLNVIVSGLGNSQAFTLFNTHSLPTVTSDTSRQTRLRHRYFAKSGGAFAVSYTERQRPLAIGGASRLTTLDRDLFTPPPELPYRAVEAVQDMNDYWTAPFFYSDARSVFYVRTLTRPIRLIDWGGFTIAGVSGTRDIPKVPPLVVQVDPRLVPVPRPWQAVAGGLVGDPAPIAAYVGAGGLIRQGVASAGTLAFGGRAIGPSGTVAPAALTQEELP